MTVRAVIVAAGRGTRAGAAKQFSRLAGQSVLWHAARPFLHSAAVSEVRIVVAADAVPAAQSALGDSASQTTILPNGGDTRMESVRGGLVGIPDDDWVLVHDAARPCLTDAALARLLAARAHPDGGLLALPVRETLKSYSEGGPPLQTLPRSGKYLAQTPQLFPAGLLSAALKAAAEAGCAVGDESQAMEEAGHRPLLVEGEAENIKITAAADFALAEAILLMRRNKEAAA